MAHWGSPDPAALEGTQEQKRRLFIQVASQIARRVELLCALPDSELKKMQIERIAERTPLPR